jgi:GDPmannose 4,6-dehydratase
MTQRSALVTGASGQDGWYLIKFLLAKGYQVHAQSRFPAGPDNHWEGIRWYVGDLTNSQFLEALVMNARPAEIYNLAAISRPQLSWKYPLETAQLNAIVPHRLCEIVRNFCPEARLFQASSSEMFGAIQSAAQDEETACVPNTPYGVAKAYAHRIVGTYRAQYGLHLSAGILFNHESPRRPLNFVSQKIAHGVASIALGLKQTTELDERGQPILEAGRIHLGNIDSQRDFGFAGDYVEAMHAIVQNKVADDFVIGTGEPHTIAEFCEVAFRLIGRDWHEHVESRADLVRKTDDDTRANPSKLKSRLGFQFKTTFSELVSMMVHARIELLQKSFEASSNSRP